MSSSTTFLYAVISGVLPSLIWLWFWLREDAEHAEPKALIFATFISGFLAVVAAIFAEKYIADMGLADSTRYTLWAAAEEICKFLAVAAIALCTDYNDEPIDAMVYCIVGALGFAALENTLFFMQSLSLSNGDLLSGFVTGNMRFIGATLVHIVSSASIGFALGLTFYKGRIVKIMATLIGLGIAVGLHTAFNLSIINADPSETLRTFSWVWGAVVILIVMFEEVKAVRPQLS